MSSSELELLQQSGVASNQDDGLRSLVTARFFESISRDSDKAPVWWSPERDAWLKRFYKKVDHLSSATNSMVAKMAATPPIVTPINPNVHQHRVLATRFQNMLLNNSGIRKGWFVEYQKFMLDYFTQDNGAFMLVMADGLKSESIAGYNRYGVQHLESSRCVRTGNDEYPVVYEHWNGSRYKLHHTRVMSMVSMPQPELENYGIGFCAVSRALESAQAILDIAVYKGEKMGSRPLRGVATLSGMAEDDMINALKNHEKQLDSRNLTRFSKILLLAGIDPLKFELHDLNRIPDGFDERTSITLSMYTIAMAFGVDPRELWPATESGATKADANIQHQKALGKEYGNIMRNVERLITDLFLPDTLQMTFDAPDDQQDKTRADIRTSRARYRKLEQGVLSPESILTDMRNTGDIDDDIYNAERLRAYRLPSGDHIKTLFFSYDPFFVEHLDFGISATQLIKFNDSDRQSIYNRIPEMQTKIFEILANSSNARILQKARQAEKAVEYVQYKFGDLQPEVIVDSITLANPDRDNEIEAVDSPFIPTNVSNDPSVAGNRSQDVRDTDADLSKSFDEHERVEHLVYELRKDYGAYRFRINELFLNFFYENITEAQFNSGLNKAIEEYYRDAYLSALAECSRGTLTLEIQRDLNDKIKEAKSYVPKLIADINSGNITLEELSRRVDLWANNYRTAQTLARLFCDPTGRYEWVFDPEKEHCVDCLALNGTVLTLNEWLSFGVLPQSSKLECGGWQCGCSLVPTNKAVTSVPTNIVKSHNKHHEQDICTI